MPRKVKASKLAKIKKLVQLRCFEFLVIGVFPVGVSATLGCRKSAMGNNKLGQPPNECIKTLISGHVQEREER